MNTSATRNLRHRHWRRLLVGLTLGCVLAASAAAETLRVGPDQRFRLPSQALAAAKPGDTIVIAAGVYQNCLSIRVDDLTIVAEPDGAAELTGPVCAGKGLLVASAQRLTVIGLTFRGAVAAAGNGAGIRAEAGDVTVRRSRFIDNQNGILASTAAPARLTIEDSVFTGNGALIGDCAHGVYAGALALVVIQRSRFEETRICHHVKSRAARTEITDSVIVDGADRQTSYLVDIPNGGDLVLRNSELRKGPRAQNPGAAVVIGAEGVTHPTTILEITGNRFANVMPRGTVFVRNRSGTAATLRGNRLSGQVTALEGPGTVR
jgi:hypothetical protein